MLKKVGVGRAEEIHRWKQARWSEPEDRSDWTRLPEFGLPIQNGMYIHCLRGDKYRVSPLPHHTSSSCFWR